MIIELFGLEASGKSTVARRLEKENIIKRSRIKNKSELLWFNLIFLIKHPIKFFSRLKYIFSQSSNLKMFHYKFMNVFLNSNAKYQKALKYSQGLLDQGYIQGIVSIFEKPQTKEEIAKYLKTILLPDFLIVFNITRADQEPRLKTRGYFTRPWLSDSYLAEWKKTVDHNYQLVLDLISQEINNVIVIDAFKSKDQVYNQVKSLIKNA